MLLARIGRQLAAGGLRQDLIASGFGARTAIAAAARRDRLATRADHLARTPAGLLVGLFVAELAFDRDVVGRQLAPLVDDLLATGLLHSDGDRLAAPRAILPHRDALICAPWTALPDDSSLHLLGALPPRPGTWLDVGTGSAFAPLIAARGATLACDVAPELVEAARIGVALSGRTEVELGTGDLFAPAGERRFDLVTFNAPIEGARPLLERFWAAAGRHLAPAGQVITHSIIDEAQRERASALGGTFVSCRYTPEGFQPAFALSAWSPGETPRFVAREVNLSTNEPHARRDWILVEDIG